MQAIRHVVLVLAVGVLSGLASGGAVAGWVPGVVVATDLQGQTDWTGFYVGGKLGGAWSSISWTHDANLFTNNTAGVVTDFSPSGIAGGIIGGANLQNGQWVFGLELSYSGTDLSQTITSPFNPTRDTFSTQIDWLGTVEGRIGYSFDHYLVFGKGGWVGSNASLTLVANTDGTTAKTDEFVDGWTIGGGIEFMAWPSVVFGLGYDYVNLNLSSSPSCPLCVVGVTTGTAPATVTGDATISSVMVRASYLFAHED